MTAYCLFQNLEITDREKMDQYVAAAMPLTVRFGGEYVVLGGETHVMEGDWRPTGPVMIRFPSMAAAQAWYQSADYAPLKALRLSAGRFSAVFIEGAA
ncbi:MAG: DUF1330 domain-containing protein [Xanthomonadales bacterium]|nr:DUF1330 domain-containing protein [Xanthomonadales bacterium]